MKAFRSVSLIVLPFLLVFFSSFVKASEGASVEGLSKAINTVEDLNHLEYLLERRGLDLGDFMGALMNSEGKDTARLLLKIQRLRLERGISPKGLSEASQRAAINTAEGLEGLAADLESGF